MFICCPSQAATETIENEKEEVRLPKDDVRRRGQEEKMGSHFRVPVKDLQSLILCWLV